MVQWWIIPIVLVIGFGFGYGCRGWIHKQLNSAGKIIGK
jgi:hypothetical protein